MGDQISSISLAPRKYDVAISLLERDLPLAKQISAKLEGQFTAFLYSESQKDIAFRDGAELLSRIYKTESRAVLILLRRDWGTTRWTKVEKEAILSRRVETTASFLLVVPMEPMPIPDWVPTQYIYQEFEKWGLETLIGSMRAKIKDLGGEIRELTPMDLALKQKTAREWKSERERRLLGSDATTAIERETSDLYARIQQCMKEIAPTIQGRPMEFEQIQRTVNIVKYPCCVRINQYEQTYDTVLVRRISVQEYDGVLGLYGPRSNSFEPTETRREDYGIDVDQSGNWFWRDVSTNDELTTLRLADRIISSLLSRTYEFDSGQRTRKRPAKQESQYRIEDFPISDYDRD